MRPFLRALAVTLATAVVVSACTRGDTDPATTTAPLFAADFEPLTIEAPDCDYGGSIRSLSAPNRITVRIELCEPDVSLASKLTSAAFGIFPSGFLDEAAESGPEVFADPVGTGPYRVGTWVPGTELRFERFADHYAGQAETETLVFRWDEDPAARLEALVAREVDGIDDVAPDDLATVAGDEALRLFPRTGTNVSYLGFNHDLEPFTDEGVRQAIALGLDRAAIVAEHYPPGTSMAEQSYPSSLAGWTPTPVWPAQDTAAARQLLGTSGATGATVALAYPEEPSPALPDPRGTAESLQNQLADLGMTADLAPMAEDELQAAVDAGEMPMFLGTWEATVPETAVFFEELFGDEATGRFGAPYPDVVEAIAAARIGSVDARYLANEDVAQAIIDRVPMVPLAHVGGATAYRADVVDTDAFQFGLDDFQPTASPFDAEYFDSMRPGDRDTFVWLQATEPQAVTCANETDADTLRACAQVNQPLVELEVGSGEVAFGPGLSEFYEAQDDATVWTFRLTDGVKFHDGSDLDAADVVRSLAVHWDASDPLHRGEYPMFQRSFGAFLEP